MATGQVAGMRVAVVAATWHAEVQEALLLNAVAACREAGVEPLVVRVPGAFELPVIAQRLAVDCDAVIALGTIIRGGTPHFDYVCDAVTAGLLRVALDAQVPVAFGVLTCDDEAQALARAGLPGSIEDKGREAAEAALATAGILRDLRLVE
jgi:6,7-dimethyl-8-ribityllumazine synthase